MTSGALGLELRDEVGKRRLPKRWLARLLTTGANAEIAATASDVTVVSSRSAGVIAGLAGVAFAVGRQSKKSHLGTKPLGLEQTETQLARCAKRLARDRAYLRRERPDE
jgi:hypothetical protein